MMICGFCGEKPDGRAVGGDAEARAEPIVGEAAMPDAERDRGDDGRDSP